jgi:superfamily II DNA or RNA helicase
MLLIQRSRIAKKARIKPGLAAGVIKRDYKQGQSWLVYCEDADQLAETMRLLVDAGLSPLEYHSNMAGDKLATLTYFRQFGGILVSIRCLDEGVDIPAVSHAFILASSQNPRQFIQRRGRVLRKSPDKHMAVIHDAIVIPVEGDDDQSQTSLLRAELVRALQFARSAINKMAGVELETIALNMGIDIDNAGTAGIEEEEPSE